jgi:hypothetical protein
MKVTQKILDWPVMTSNQDGLFCNVRTGRCEEEPEQFTTGSGNVGKKMRGEPAAPGTAGWFFYDVALHIAEHEDPAWDVSGKTGDQQP